MNKKENWKKELDKRCDSGHGEPPLVVCSSLNDR